MSKKENIQYTFHLAYDKIILEGKKAFFSNEKHIDSKLICYDVLYILNNYHIIWLLVDSALRMITLRR
jgi:hypothetical protein